MKYTLGEIHRLGLLRNFEGKPYRHRSTITDLMRHYPHELVKVKNGTAKMYTQQVIDAVNSRFKKGS